MLIILGWRIWKHKSLIALIGLILLLPLFLSPCYLQFVQANAADGIKEYRYNRYYPPSEHGLLGTDTLGRDVFFSTVVAGANTWSITFLSLIIAVLLGLIFGLLAVSNRNVISWLANIVMQFFEVFPFIFFLMITIAAYRQHELITIREHSFQSNVIFIGLMLGLISMPYFGRVVERFTRNELLNPYIHTLRISGISTRRIFWRNILLNNIMPQVLVQISMLVGIIILMSSSINYILEIGFGGYGKAGILSLGKLLAQSRESIIFGKGYWAILPPTIGILFSIIGSGLVMEGLTKRSNKLTNKI